MVAGVVDDDDVVKEVLATRFLKVAFATSHNSVLV